MVAKGLFGLLLCALTVFSANAVPIIGNLPGNDGSSTFISAPAGGSNTGGPEASKSAGFTMGASRFLLDSVDLRIEFFDAAVSNPVVALYDDLAGVPNASLITLVAPVLLDGVGTFSFTPASPFVLQAATTYWATVSNAADIANSFRWMASSPGETPTGSAATHMGYRFSNTSPPPTGNSSFFNSYSVNGTPVPEPASVALMGLAIAALGFTRRKTYNNSQRG